MGSNFSQALKELTGFDKSDEIVIGKTEELKTQKKPIMETLQKAVTENDINQRNNTRITSSMVIDGNIISEDKITNLGKVNGSITSENDVIISNYLDGDLKAINITVQKAKIKGNIEADNMITVDTDSVIAGDIKAQKISNSGKVKGNLDISGSCYLKDTCLVVGDIYATGISMDPNSKLIGSLKTRMDAVANDVDINAIFNFGGDK